MEWLRSRGRLIEIEVEEAMHDEVPSADAEERDQMASDRDFFQSCGGKAHRAH